MPINDIDTIKIDYHLSHLRTACQALTKGVDTPQEFQRLMAITEASMTAIALEFGVIQAIGNGCLPLDHWFRTLKLIRDYEAATA